MMDDFISLVLCYTIADVRSSCDVNPTDKWILLPRDCYHTETGARRMNVGQCSMLHCITKAKAKATVSTCRDVDLCCGVSKWTFVNVTCPHNSLSSFKVSKVSECACTKCVQRKASLYAAVRWQDDGSRVERGLVQSFDGMTAGHLRDGHYEWNISFNLAYLPLKFDLCKGLSSRLCFSPTVRVLPFSLVHDVVHHIHVISPTHTQRVDCRSSTVIYLSTVDGRNDSIALETSLIIGRESFRYKNGSICSSFVNFRVIYASAHRPSLAVETPGVFEYANDDGSSGLVQPLFLLMFSAVNEADEYVDIVRPLRFYVYSPLQNILISSRDPLSSTEDDTTPQPELFVLPDWSVQWRIYNDETAVRKVRDKRDTITGVLPYYAPAFAVGRKMKKCYARVGAVDRVGNLIGGIRVTVTTLYDVPYMTTTSKWLTSEDKEICVSFACNHEAIIKAVRTSGSRPVCLSPSDTSDDQSNICYHKDGAIYILSTAPVRVPLYHSLYSCQLSSTEDRRFLFVTPRFVSSFVAVQHTTETISPHDTDTATPKFYFFKVSVTSSLGRQYVIRASTFVLTNDGYELYGWQQEPVDTIRNQKSFVCVEAPVPRRGPSNDNEVMVLVDVHSVVETGEGRNVCRRQSLIQSSKPYTTIDSNDYESKFVLPAVGYGSTIGVYTDSTSRRAEMHCLDSLSERTSSTRKTKITRKSSTAAIAFICS